MPKSLPRNGRKRPREPRPNNTSAGRIAGELSRLHFLHFFIAAMSSAVCSHGTRHPVRRLFAAQDNRGRIIAERAAARKLLHIG
jgi:hypothetical protein